MNQLKLNQNVFQTVLSNLKRARWLAVLGGILILGILFTVLEPKFLQYKNIENIIVQSAVTGVLAVGMTFVIMTAGIDISVGGILFLTLVIATELSLAGAGGAGWVVYIVAILLGAGLGLLNGLVINFIGINPVITTLATLSAFRGLAIHINQARITSPPESARFLGTGDIFGIPMPLITLIAIVIIGGFIMNRTRFGRYALAVGASRQSAKESGLPVRWTTILVYVLTGLCAGIAGLIMLGRVGAVQTDMGIGIEFTVITATVLGGTVLSGGKASIFGSFMGAILLVMINNGLNLVDASAYIYDIVRGSVLIIAVLLDRASQVNLYKTLFRKV